MSRLRIVCSSITYTYVTCVCVCVYVRVSALHSQLAGLGEVFKSTEPVRITEEATEYTITVVKHMFDSHIVLQYDCTNTIQEQVLENCTVVVDLAEAVSVGPAEHACAALTRVPPCGWVCVYPVARANRMTRAQSHVVALLRHHS